MDDLQRSFGWVIAALTAIGIMVGLLADLNDLAVSAGVGVWVAAGMLLGTSDRWHASQTYRAFHNPREPLSLVALLTALVLALGLVLLAAEVPSKGLAGLCAGLAGPGLVFAPVGLVFLWLERRNMTPLP